ncbi:MAG: hypothetical protein NTZ94_18545 [Verrucomicrobia bacterium]|nr:hypothetical protein [Verrucomicrobiota bacterium]
MRIPAGQPRVVEIVVSLMATRAIQALVGVRTQWSVPAFEFLPLLLAGRQIIIDGDLMVLVESDGSVYVR